MRVGARSLSSPEQPPEPAPFTRGLPTLCPYRGAGGMLLLHRTLRQGSLRSSNPDRIAKLVGEAVSAGAYEVRLAAQDTGVYGDDIGSSLPALLRLVSSVDGDFRIRVGMLNPLPPAQIDDLVSSYASRKVYKFAPCRSRAGATGSLPQWAGSTPAATSPLPLPPSGRASLRSQSPLM